MGSEMGLPDDWMYWVAIIVLAIWLKRRAGIGR
jgi:hypothetical protein